jgi:MraZ protein
VNPLGFLNNILYFKKVINKVGICGRKWDFGSIFESILKQEPKMAHLIGTHECKLDAKGRLLFPSSIRKQLSDTANEGFVIKPSTDGLYLELYLQAEFQKKLDFLQNNLNPFIPENQQYARFFIRGSRTVELDPVGRLLIPKDLIGFAQIKGDLVIQPGLNGIIEIWEKEAYEKDLSQIGPNYHAMGKAIWSNPLIKTNSNL